MHVIFGELAYTYRYYGGMGPSHAHRLKCSAGLRLPALTDVPSDIYLTVAFRKSPFSQDIFNSRQTHVFVSFVLMSMRFLVLTLFNGNQRPHETVLKKKSKSIKE